VEELPKVHADRQVDTQSLEQPGHWNERVVEVATHRSACKQANASYRGRGQNLRHRVFLILYT
jgi:hypothetical protein